MEITSFAPEALQSLADAFSDLRLAVLLLLMLQVGLVVLLVWRR